MIRFFFVLASLLCSATAWAQPSLQTVSDVDQDARIELTIPTQTIDGDTRSYCEVRLTVGQDEVELRQGDTIRVQVFEYDATSFSDEIFDIVFQVSASDVQAGIDRTFDCSGDFIGDLTGDMEIYARAEVQKAACGLGCFYDRPTTDNAPVEVRDDDDDEPNDARNEATEILLGASSGYIARNDDWMALEVSEPSRIEVQVAFRPAAGRVEVTLHDGAGSVVATASELDDGAGLVLDPAPIDSYSILVTPKEEDDFVFYGLDVVVEPSGAGSCTGSETETVPCGNCGFKSRTCSGGVWSSFTSCSSEGVCAPGEQSSESCGVCGTRSVTCSDSCTWVQGSCTDSCASESAELGDACAGDGACVADLECFMPPAELAFTEGYCSTSCTTSTDCGNGGLCAQVFGESVCLATCADQLECRLGYQCIDFQGTGACLPACTTDSVCTDPSAPVCDEESGVCVAGDGETPGGRGGGSGGLPRNEGCAAGPTSWAMAALALLVRRRRKSRR